MDKPLAFLKVIGAGVTAAFSYIFGGADSLLCILMVFITLDYVTGVIVGIINKKLSSEVGFKGLLKKTGILVIVAVAHLPTCLL
jgi:toxin secretion/phage lysis holin